jgi:hypothetical protein
MVTRVSEGCTRLLMEMSPHVNSCSSSSSSNEVNDMRHSSPRRHMIDPVIQRCVNCAAWTPA